MEDGVGDGVDGIGDAVGDGVLKEEIRVAICPERVVCVGLAWAGILKCRASPA